MPHGLFSKIAIIGGADPKDPRASDDYVRHVAVGLLIVAMAIWALLGGTHLGVRGFHLALPWALIPGLLLSAVVTFIDILITVTFLPSSTVAARVRLVAVRGVLSLGMGAALGYVSLLVIYDTTITQFVDQANRDKAAAIAAGYTKNSLIPGQIEQAKTAIANDQKAITAANSQLAGADKALAKVQDQVTAAKKAWLDDTLPCTPNSPRACNGDYAGAADVSKALKGAYDRASTQELPEAQRTHTAAVTTLKAMIAGRQSDITTQQGKIDKLSSQLSGEIAQAQKATLEDTGTQARGNALLKILREQPLAWIWPLFFLAIDLVIASLKAILPESTYDRRRRQEAAVDDAAAEGLDRSPQLQQVREVLASELASIKIARIRADARKRLARIEAETAYAISRAAPPATSPPQPPATRGRRVPARAWRRQAAALSAVALVAIGALTLQQVGAPQSAASSRSAAGQVLDLADGQKLTVPQGAISGDAKVQSHTVSASSWQAHKPLTSAVELTTGGQVVGRPVLTWTVPASMADQAQRGEIQLAFASDDPSGWTTYPSTYDPATRTFTAQLQHFSTWQFWTWDWPSIGANISQKLGELSGRRASDAPQCTSGIKPPAWYNINAGITADAAMVVRACVEGHKGDDQLVVQMVNNRPYGLMLHYKGSAVGFGWHQDPATLPDVLRNAIAETGDRSQGLYLPPLSRASVGIQNPGSGKRIVFSITPTSATIAGDLAGNLATEFVGFAADKATVSVTHDWFSGQVAASCSKLAVSSDLTTIPDAAEVYKAITGDAFPCVRDTAMLLAQNELTQAVSSGRLDASKLDSAKIARLNKGISGLDKLIARGIPDLENKLGDALDFAVDKKYAGVPELGFGFSILAHQDTSQDPPSPQPNAPQPNAPQPNAPQPNAPQPNAPQPNAPQPTAVTVIDNYGPAVGAGFPVCRGNPDRGESMPSGTVTQTFTVPSGTVSLDGMQVQVTADAQTTVHATVTSSSGNSAAAESAASTEDLRLDWPAMKVSSGETVTITLTLSATFGKTATVYIAGSGLPGGAFTVSDTCPDGAANASDTAHGLRMQVFGTAS